MLPYIHSKENVTEPIACSDIEFYVQRVKLYGTVLVSKVNGKIMVSSF
ncbi:MAG: hypothetical protein QXZ08_03875 [Nitrososphaeria archaeon]